MTESKTNLLGVSLPELEELVRTLGAPAYRGRQIFRQIHRNRVFSFDQMTDLPKQFQSTLDAKFCIKTPKIEQKLASGIDDTVKYLYRLQDGNLIETVRMVYRHGITACISTQAGCRMGCAFCASAPMGFSRNLTAAEMLGQIYAADSGFEPGGRIDHVVLMGIGEPLDNYENVMDFLRLISDPDGRNLSPRHITISTCGLVPQIRRLAEENLPVTLSVSLHSANDEKRRALMPVARRYPLETLLDAAEEYFRKTGRRVTFEYAVIAGENDTPQDAAELRDCLRAHFPGQRPHVNLIPVNPVDGTSFRPGAVERFRQQLCESGLNATVRRTLGADIAAACGQLRRGMATNQKESVVSGCESVSGL